MTTTPPSITALPTAPDPNDRTTFNARAYPWSAALPAFGTEVSAVAANVKANADEAAASAVAATEQAALSAADVALTHDDAVATAADRVQTGLDASTASTAAIAASKLNLGSKTSAPSLDNQGAALLAGATYYDTTLSLWRVWSGTAWAEGISAVAGVSSINGMTGNVVLPPTQSVAYDSRATLRSQTPAAGDQAIVKDLGLFVWEAASTEPDDDESCFSTADGCWLLQAASWDLVDAWQAPDLQAQTDDDEDEPLRFASSFASKVIRQTYTNTISSASTTPVTQVVSVQGASIGDAVVITRPSVSASNPQGNVFGIVTAANTVTVYYGSGYSTTYFQTTGLWIITVIKS
ncbi:hypothetical protein [Rhodoferax sp.]|uniref:hypothetical protein n=1 Tax=Rhodoferax sp. TaxID=50421 RepID=UPI00261738F0|nr:hypothetical protein [Rhodoferax sp.]MDD5479643.1 hypothetical protein [Rhodoferax sp.]